MQSILLDRCDAILGAELKPVILGDTSHSLLEAITDALRLWAPTAIVKSIRLEPSIAPAAPLNGILTARIYAKSRPDDGNMVLHLTAQTADAPPITATVQLLLPSSLDPTERTVCNRIE